MAKEVIIDDFVRRILLCIGEKKLTQTEIELRYDELYPPTFLSLRWVFKRRDPTRSSVSVSDHLVKLIEQNLIKKEITRFLNGKPLKKDVALYSLSASGYVLLVGRR